MMLRLVVVSRIFEGRIAFIFKSSRSNMRFGSTYLRAHCYNLQGRNSLINQIIVEILKYKVNWRILFIKKSVATVFVRNVVMFSNITQSICSLYLPNKHRTSKDL